MILQLIRLIPDNTKIDFFGHRLFGYLLTAVIILGSFALLATKGLNLGVDFTGGTVIEIQTTDQPDIAELRVRLNALNLGAVSIQEFGSDRDLMIRLPQQEGGPDEQQAAIAMVQDSLMERFTATGVEIRRVEFVGPQVGKELKVTGLIAILLSLAGILVYIAFRFEWQYGVGAVAALAHDVIAILGLFSLTQMQFDLATLAAILLVAGYSINDTVIIYDRVRELLRKYKKMQMPEVINTAINSTLARTLMTSGTTMLVLVALWLFGGEVIRGFVSALFFGILVGTHSSYFVAAPILNALNLRNTSKVNREGEAEASA